LSWTFFYEETRKVGIQEEIFFLGFLLSWFPYQNSRLKKQTNFTAARNYSMGKGFTMKIKRNANNFSIFNIKIGHFHYNISTVELGLGEPKEEQIFLSKGGRKWK
jgi:hypothetical protein